MTDTFSLKDHLFNEAKVRYLAGLLVQAWPSFAGDEFISDCMCAMPSLALKNRIRFIAELLHQYLPADYTVAVGIIIASLPPPLDITKSDNDFGDFIFAPYGEYVSRYGCTAEHVMLSFAALEQITMRFSVEDAIRNFLRSFPVETLAKCQEWTTHPHYHVRRLVSEGTRPLLPWSGRVPQTAADTLPLLSVLYADTTRYVTRSVANHLNDIVKIDPSLVVRTLRCWQQEGKQSSPEFAWLMRHTLRTLVKRGDQSALALLGYHSVPVTVKEFVCRTTGVSVKQGGEVELELTISRSPGHPILIDYCVHFIKKHSVHQKVFKWTVVQPSETLTVSLRKRHRLKADATTYTLYAGVHIVTLHVNGVVCGQTQFVVT
jgi:3-methyladenine DNA glycosylase AlkC